MSNPISLEQMSRRYTHAEREGISCGTLGRGDISGWARPTTGASRPEVKGKIQFLSAPYKRLEDYGMTTPAVAPHEPKAVFMPANSKPDPRLDMGRAAIIADVSRRLTNHAIKCRKKMSKPKPELTEVDLLGDCPASDPGIIAILRGKTEVERDCELHNDTPLPYDRATKASGWRR